MFALKGHQKKLLFAIVRWPLVRTVALTGLLLAGACWLKDARDQLALRRVAYTVVDPAATSGDEVRRLAEWIHEAAFTARNPRSFLLSSLRATPAQILRDGGDCADKSRLLVAMLDAIRIPATSVMLFDVNTGQPCHTVVEAEFAPGRSMVADPTFGLTFPSPQGGYMGLAELRAHPEWADVEILRRQSQAPWPARVCFYRLSALSYAGASSFRWDANMVARTLHALLQPCLGENLYHARRTAWLERPALTCAALITIITVATCTMLIIVRPRLRKRTRASVRVIRLVRPPSVSAWMTPSLRRLLAILAVATALRLAWLAIAQPTPVSDFRHYRDLAVDLLDHGQFGWPVATAYRLPLYPVLLATLMCVSRDVLWLSVCNVALSVGLVGAVYALARRMTNDSSAAVAAAACCALNTTFVLFAPVLASEHLFAMLIVLGWLILAAGSLRVGLRIVAAGACLGLACLTRGEGLFWLPVFLFVAWRGSANRRAALTRCASLVLTTAILLLPWLARNRIALGPGIGLTTSSGVNFYLAHNPDGYGYRAFDETPLKGIESTPRHHVAMELGKAHVFAAPVDAMLNLPRGTAQLYRPSNYGLYWSTGWSPSVSSGAARDVRHSAAWLLSGLTSLTYVGLLALGATGLWLMTDSLRGARRELLLAIGMNWVCYVVVFWADGRYRFTIEALLCVPASVALTTWRRALAARAGDVALRAGVLSTT